MKKPIGTLCLTWIVVMSLTSGEILAAEPKKSAKDTTKNVENDTLKTINLDKVVINATRASKNTPLTYSELSKKQISLFSTAQDLPFLLLTTPSVVVTSDAGAGVGYTSIRIRGTDPSRINITANDIPMNDAESHSLFWVNMPDLTSSIEDIQIQRGVGGSTNGAGAFGGSINIRTSAPASRAYGELSGGYGSFNTHRQVVKLGSGLIKDHFAFDGRLSNIHSDGYIDRATTDLQSYFFQGAYYGKTNSLKFITFGGKEKTYHAWNGVGRATLDTNRTYNPSGEMWSRDGKFLGFYDNQTDNYNQTNYQLLFNQMLGRGWGLDIKLHYTDGNGYYEEYKNGRKLKEYGLQPFTIAGDSVVSTSNLVRRKQMVNGFGGAVFSVNYLSDKLNATFGGAANQYGGQHFGRVVWVQDYVGNWNPDHEYYRNRSIKTDVNIYLKANYKITKELSIYADMQYRHINHLIEGRNDNWDWVNGEMQRLDINNFYNFFNPKVGLFYQINQKNNLYASFAVAHKEPTRNNYTDGRIDRQPRPERLMDYEAGYAFRSPFFSFGATLYYMEYKDQLVLTGALNEIGEPMAENVERSYRAGLELTAGFQFTKWLNWSLNATLSRNKILNYTEYVDNYDASGKPLYTQTTIVHKETDISFSPALTAGSLIAFELKSWRATFQSNYVSRQYLTNAQQIDVSLDPYFVNNLMVSYTFRFPVVRELTISANVNNIFNERYSSNGWGGSSMVNGKRENYAGYFPQAGIHFMGNITLKF